MKTKYALKTAVLSLWVYTLLMASTPASRASQLSTGSIVTTNFYMVAHFPFTKQDGTVVPAGSRVTLQDFTNSIIFFEWFAIWCPYCNAAAPQVKSGIEDWYSARGGNVYGIPVIVVDVNQQPGASWVPSTDSFFKSYAISNVVDDFDSNQVNYVKNLFNTGGGQPLFVCVNLVSNSPTTAYNRVLIDSLNYGQTDFTSTLATFRATIDAVQAPVKPPRLMNHQRSKTDFSFDVVTQPGRTYRVQYTTNLVNWLTLTNITGTNTLQNIRHLNPPASRSFYRLVTP